MFIEIANMTNSILLLAYFSCFTWTNEQ